MKSVTDNVRESYNTVFYDLEKMVNPKIRSNMYLVFGYVVNTCGNQITWLSMHI